MKKRLYLLSFCLFPFFLCAQTSITTTNSNSTTISPNGIVDNRPQALSATNKYIAIGDSAMYSNVSGEAVVGIGHKTLAKSTAVGYSVAIGDRAMYNSIQGYSNIGIGPSALYSTNSYNNIGIGLSALFHNNNGINNIGLGSMVLFENTNGEKNIVLGNNAMWNSKSLSESIVIGNGALYNLAYENINNSVPINLIAIGNNVAKNFTIPSNYHQMGYISNVLIGNNSFTSAVSGDGNTTLGVNTLSMTNNSSNNTAVGNSSLQSLQNNELIHGENSALGVYSLVNLLFGSRNTAMGTASGNSLVNGNNNTFLGTSSGVNVTPYATSVSNAMALGFNAKVNTDNKVVIGDANVSQIGGYATWTNYSDKRLKENISYDNSLGLSFINELKTAKYNYIADENKNVRNGLIAQDVKEILLKNNWTFSGLIEDNDLPHTLNLSYSELVIPLINAVKELSTENESLKMQLSNFRNEIDKIKEELTSKSNLN
ncbi:hypothetical protein EGI22_10210 [Lacihabitans sp. LS3-19]|uniref:tail fiber domain-containing protein n=1 Tax=Lacihabitans sp. LS3-19 TaxID=2487335 RepID=UPI0020CC206B|nr:tail fiber domain-containing protein [Lacihabitans sp. LS3-19]MCP9768286.1 hypothetical protein [Lacihabitans sp. LS3-19]